MADITKLHIGQVIWVGDSRGASIYKPQGPFIICSLEQGDRCDKVGYRNTSKRKIEVRSEFVYTKKPEVIEYKKGERGGKASFSNHEKKVPEKIFEILDQAYHGEGEDYDMSDV